MEQWEIDLRTKLDEEIAHGTYKIGGEKLCALTGKAGYINYLVELERYIRMDAAAIIKELEDEKSWENTKSLYKQMMEDGSSEKYSTFNLEEFAKQLKDFYDGNL